MKILTQLVCTVNWYSGDFLVPFVFLKEDEGNKKGRLFFNNLPFFVFYA